MRGGGRIVSLGAVSGLTFVRADKDGDGDFDPLISDSWWGDAFAASTGTINWNTVFGVPAAAKAVFIWVAIKDETAGVVLSMKAKSTTTNAACNLRTQVANIYMEQQGILPVATDGTSYYQFYGEVDGCFLEVVGWYL